MLKKTIICCTMIGLVALGWASSGGGKKKSSSTLRSGFTPIRTIKGFTLKAGPHYMGSKTVLSQKGNGSMQSTLVTYQKGNTIYILPYKYRTNPSKLSLRNNLNVLDMKIRLHK